MIARPTTPQLLQTIKAELNEKIAPVLTDPTHIVAVQMMTSILDSLSVRTAHEIAWMIDEANAVESAAADYVGRNPGAASVARALAAYRSVRTSSLHLAEVGAAYDSAAELLSSLADAAFAEGNPNDVRTVEQLVEQRLGNELTIVGNFVAVGRD
ncbi:MAG: hypothetical protein RL219_1462 [Actinomycetota bacterium]|jgi:hypothetical protein